MLVSFDICIPWTSHCIMRAGCFGEMMCLTRCCVVLVLLGWLMLPWGQRCMCWSCEEVWVVLVSGSFVFMGDWGSCEDRVEDVM